jgi:hypothetical protein
MSSQYLKLPLESGGGPAAGVDSFNGRTGVVASQAGDYSAGIVSNTPAGDISASNVQDAINELDTEKQATITGAASTITSADLTADRALQSNGSGKVAVSAVTSTELGHLFGVTSSVQTQLDNKQDLDVDLTALAGLSDTGLIARTGSGTVAARTIVSDASITIADGGGVSGNPTVSLPTSGVTAGNYTLSNVTVNDRGIITSIADGSPTDVSPDLIYRIADDFTGNTVALDSYGFQSTVSGTGANVISTSIFNNATDRAIGVVELESGTTSNSRATISSQIGAFATTYCTYDYQLRACLSDVGNVLQQFEATFGFIDNTSTAPNHTDGIYFRFEGNGTNVNWECVTSASSVRTTVTTSSPVLINNFQIFRIFINEAGDQVQFYIDGVLVATITTNIPVPSAGQFFGMGAKIGKLLGTGEEYNLYCDWIYLTATYSAPRG